MQVAGADGVQVLIESSSAIAEAGQYCLAALETGKNLVMMNAEADLIFGPHLMRLAHTRGLVYTSCDGDQHGVIKHLVDDLEFRVIVVHDGCARHEGDPPQFLSERGSVGNQARQVVILWNVRTGSGRRAPDRRRLVWPPGLALTAARCYQAF
jgi:hypothetical protein